MRTAYFLLVIWFVANPAPLQAQVKFGAIGDSLTDEHFDQSGFGTNLGYSHNALELMVLAGKIDAGPTGSWGGTRGTGYEYNWALAGATTDSLISNNQHVNLANQVPAAGISKAILLVGSNNLFPSQPTGMASSNYEAIYEGLATQTQIDQLISQAVNEVVLAAQTLKASGVDLVVGTAPDYGISPFAKNYYPDPVKRELVDDVMETFNIMVRDRMITDLGLPVIDTYQLTKDI